MQEKWKKIKFNKSWSISNLGNVKHNDNLIKPHDDYRSYYNVCIDGKYYKIHRLVAIHFKRNPLNKKIVNHKNGNKKDNRASNLEWVSQSENIKHAWKKGLIKRRKYD